MKSVLAELYHGNYAPQEDHSYRSDSEYGKVFERLVALEDVLLQNMTEKDKEVFEAFNRESADLASITGEWGFEDGVRFGLRLMIEILTG